MNQEIRSVLRKIVQRHGRDLVKHPSLCDAYLADFLPMHPQVRRYLVKALQSGIVNQMLPEPDPNNFMALSKQLAQLTALQPAEAHSIIQYWGYALATDPEQVLASQANSSTKKPLLALLAGIIGLGVIGLLWGINHWQTQADTLPILADSSELMSGAKPVFIEAVEIANNTNSNTASPMQTASNFALSPLTQATWAMASNTAQAQSAPANSATLPAANLAEPVLPTEITTLAPEQLQRFQQVQRAQQLNQDALNALQHFLEAQQRYTQKQQALQTLNVMFASTQESYYRQQQQAMVGQIQQLEQQLDESLKRYNSALQGLCSVIDGDVLLLDTLAGTALQTLIQRQVSQCHANQVLSLQRDQLIQSLQALQAQP
ncbi:hypothetical protein [Thiofilum flexile]|uniref:hypothetical protein n=1 Tax=Thiofilum flexile TaxID=125627 RepID=UPI0003800939|nr:hypothetical protein [Thiofilum flexile]